MTNLITVPIENWEYGKKCIVIVQRLKDEKHKLLLRSRHEEMNQVLKNCIEYTIATLQELLEESKK